MQAVLDEVMELFPSTYIHIGSDEVPKERWKACPVCQARIRSEKLKNEEELQGYFTARIAKYINDKGRKIIGWDEMTETGIPATSTVMIWRGERFGVTAAKHGHDVIMSPEHPLYLNHLQSKNEDSITQGGYNSLEAVYNYEPVPSELSVEQQKRILGAQGNVWTEYINNQSKLEYMIFPRMSALAEVAWSPKAKRDWSNFEKKLPALIERYRTWQTNYSNAYYDIQPTVIPFAQGGIAWRLETKNKNARIIYVLGKTRNATFRYNGPVHIRRSGSWGAALAAPDHRLMSNWTWQDFSINRATGKKVTLTNPPNKMYAGSDGFTLVDGIQNNMGMVKSSQFLGFIGKDMEAVIDLQNVQLVSEIILHVFEQTASSIYRPASVSFLTSIDGKNYKLMETLDSGLGVKNLIYHSINEVRARYVKVVAKNYGRIPAGLPGGGSNAWLFSDEIEIK
jgi:hexosaminidase